MLMRLLLLRLLMSPSHVLQECERVRQEVEELRDTMFSKTFKPPSAWAEREVKYKMEKKAWEDKHKVGTVGMSRCSEPGVASVGLQPKCGGMAGSDHGHAVVLGV